MSFKPDYPVTAEVSTVEDRYTFEFEIRVQDQPVAVVMVKAYDFDGARNIAHKQVEVRQAERLLPTFRIE